MPLSLWSLSGPLVTILTLMTVLLSFPLSNDFSQVVVDDFPVIRIVTFLALSWI
jgi:hypothetical protein